MRILRLTFLFALIAGFVGLSSCKKDKDADPTIQEAQLKLLTGNSETGKTWTVSQVRFGPGNQDRTAEYAGMAIKLKGKYSATNTTINYEVTGRPDLSPWPASGTLSFDENEPENLLIREDGMDFTYSLTENQLSLNFTYSGDGYPGRISAVEGTWAISFTSN
jgi:hypothetical protein